MKKSFLFTILAGTGVHASLMAQNQPGKKPGGLMEILLLFILPFIVIFYFFFIRPQKKEQKKRQELLSAVEKGDIIRTIGGIYGKAVKVADEEVTLVIDEQKDVRITVLKRAVASIKGKTEDIEESGS